MPTLDFITSVRWDKYAMRQEKRCLREYGQSWSFCSISNAANKCVVEVRGCGVLCDWKAAKAAMKAKAESILDDKET